ncbi:hypothetical protein [Pseudomonas muyukensis]|uniref:Uncharacterized protein n=1 Tax=Pseudomonas muyukensis TaxID=2842357 RepID=A0ABX8M142_9PSED|nr:hypothetical protein [Pseudomonas muyukensis]QXH33096.1 hypothetical protein KSS95_12925 [Pseudomonas muyukensis]
MRSLFEKTFGGLTRSCYIRHAFFGALVAIFLAVLVANTPHGILGKPGFIPFVVINTLLYPYARFVYEGVIDYIVGRNVFAGPALPMMAVKCFTIAMCWTFSLFIAPIGLAYLYWYHSRAAR